MLIQINFCPPFRLQTACFWVFCDLINLSQNIILNCGVYIGCLCTSLCKTVRMRPKSSLSQNMIQGYFSL